MENFSKNYSLQNNLVDLLSQLSNNKEIGFLQEQLYNRLEDKLEDSILEINNISANSYHEKLSDTFLIKVSGLMEIEDYEKMKYFCQKNSNITEAIAYLSLVSEEGTSLKEKITNLERKINFTQDKAQKAKQALQIEYLKKQLNPKTLAQYLGLQQDEAMLQYVDRLLEDFVTKGLEFTIDPENVNDNIIFRGIINQDWLRINTNLLRSLYGGFAASNWTMVGQITLMPKPSGKTDETNIQVINELEREAKIALRDPIDDCFAAMRKLESFLVQSKQRIELIVSPLAIYRENVIKVRESTL
ncbi:MAG: hypothetical protein Tsb0014_44610 [Pleurocapsa sp.]